MQIRFLPPSSRTQLCLPCSPIDRLIVEASPINTTEAGPWGRELNHQLISAQLVPKAHFRHLIAERDGLRCRLTRDSSRPSLVVAVHQTAWTQSNIVLHSNSASYRNSFTHLRFRPSALTESGQKKHPFKQSLGAFCKRTVESPVLYVIQCPSNNKAHDKFSAKKKFVSLRLFSFIRGGLPNHISLCLNSSKLQRQVQCSNAVTYLPNYLELSTL